MAAADESAKGSGSIRGQTISYWASNQGSHLVGYGLFYNKKIFKEAGIAAPPKTWSELVADTWFTSP